MNLLSQIIFMQVFECSMYIGKYEFFWLFVIIMCTFSHLNVNTNTKSPSFNADTVNIFAERFTFFSLHSLLIDDKLYNAWDAKNWSIRT